jgi:hypothetical protein
MFPQIPVAIQAQPERVRKAHFAQPNLPHCIQAGDTVVTAQRLCGIGARKASWPASVMQ